MGSPGVRLDDVLGWPTVRAVRERYGYSATWLYDLLGRGVLTGIRVGGTWLINPQSIRQFEARPRRWRNRNSA